MTIYKQLAVAVLMLTLGGCAPLDTSAEYFRCEAIIVKIDGSAVVQTLSDCNRI